jgi:peptidoglycan/xylan/chitin deacetylase (PgdA/CDA1 family)
LDVAQFRQQIEFLMQKFTIVRMEDVLSALQGGALPDKAALLTFDDGYIEHFTTVFPLLDQMGLQGSFFPPSRILEENVLLDVNKIHFTLASADTNDLYAALLSELRFYRGKEFDIPDEKTLLQDYALPGRYDRREVVFIKQMLQTVLPERLRGIITDKLFREFVGVEESIFARELYLDTKQLTTMKKHGMFIGLHGHNHGWLGNMQPDEYAHDISHALHYMDSVKLVDKNAWVMNYPYGSYSDGVVDYIRANGCVAGFTTRVSAVDLQKADNLLLPRLDTNDFPPKSEKYRDFS